jgi:hypothetical protein
MVVSSLTEFYSENENRKVLTTPEHLPRIGVRKWHILVGYSSSQDPSTDLMLFQHHFRLCGVPLRQDTSQTFKIETK